MTGHVSSKPTDGASRLPAAAWLVLGIVLVADIMDLLDSTITAALAAGVIFFAAFAQRQRTAAVPLIKPSLLRNRGFTAGLILGLVFFATVAGLLYAVSLFLQRGVGYSPERAAVGIVIASVACRNLLTRLGRRLSRVQAALGAPRPCCTQLLSGRLWPTWCGGA
jgi:hypothetical protein